MPLVLLENLKPQIKIASPYWNDHFKQNEDFISYYINIFYIILVTFLLPNSGNSNIKDVFYVIVQIF